ncbi:glycine betaine/L-proline ABC transporter ATP-binding protein [Alginatibacterium sediminis]|uniref:Quaternary amine transport ATP-binding protein n=1 Tax=Alginatibacterium sediminis TaxID=2164068 RepID=A0A420E5D5_9ALTE|nr:glycine betaine/L-proline ABC transporter ATP-binding protein [Alginatibacterium sediminis]RKF12783.1 glycine betaine/L-proline ABC transporter ATP-binding protein [Alginatibacterium sediminis]
MSDTLIKVESLYKIFGPKPESVFPLIEQGLSKDEILAKTNHTVGLKDINLEIKRGEIFVIMGLSGSGKSTLIRHFNRLIDPSSGEIEVDKISVMQLEPKPLMEFRRHKMSMVFQNFGLLPHRTVGQNVAYGLEIQGLNKAKRQQQAQQWLEAVGLLGYENHYPSQLSGGQQQRIGLARALCTDAEILLMDEAFSALDPLIRSEMQDQLIELQEKLHKTIIFITHDLDEALRLGDRIAILKDGVIVQQGKPDEILLEPADDYVEAFVKDVNRARALTVATVMQAPAARITAETIAGALKQMKQIDSDYGHLVSDDGYQGVVTKDTLEQALKDDASSHLNDQIQDEIPSVMPDAILETVIPETLEADYALPVVDEDGHLHGELSRRDLAEVLGEQDSDKSSEKSSYR